MRSGAKIFGQPSAAPGREQQPVVQKISGVAYYTTASALSRLEDLKRNAKASYWRKLKPVIAGDPAKAMLECTDCHQRLKASNPANIGSSHFDQLNKCKFAGKGGGDKVSPAISLLDGAGPSGSAGVGHSGSAALISSSQGKRSHSDMMQSWAVHKDQADQAIQHLSRFLYKCGMFHMVEDPDLRKSFAILGVDLPGE